MILQLVNMLLILLFGTPQNNGPVHDLRKKPTREDNKRTVRNYLKGYFYRYGWIIITLLIVLGLLLFVLACFAYVGASGTESGVYYYGMEEVI